MLETRNNYPDYDPELLFELLRENAKLPQNCKNCLRLKAECLDGWVLTGKEDPVVVRKGLTVKSNKSRTSGQNSLTDGVTYTVSGLYESSGYGYGSDYSEVAVFSLRTNRLFQVMLEGFSGQVGDNCL